MKPNADEIIARFEQEERELEDEEKTNGPAIDQIGMLYKNVDFNAVFFYPSQESPAYKSKTYPESKEFRKINSAYAVNEVGELSYFPPYTLVDRAG